MSTQDSPWTEEWPTKPGRYWFFGWRTAHGNYDMDPKLMSVYARRAGGERPWLVFVADGHFFWEREGARGAWVPADVPDTEQALATLRGEE